MGVVLSALQGEPALPAVPCVLVPPLFRSLPSNQTAAVRSGYATAFNPAALRQLLHEHFVDTGVAARLLLAPPGPGGVTVRVTTSTEAARGAQHAELALRCQPMAEEPASFAELRVSDAAGARLLAAAHHEPSGLGAFAVASSSSAASSRAATPTVLGLRFSSPQLGAGFAVSPRGLSLATPSSAPSLVAPPHVAWLLARSGGVTLGAEFRPSPPPLLACAPGSVPKAPPSSAGSLSSCLSLAASFRSAPPGKATAFTSIIEATREGALRVAVAHHTAVRRRVKNPFEEDTVIAIVNYVDVGVEFTTPLAASCASRGAFALAAAWQINKAWLLKARLSSDGGACLSAAAKAWWDPALSIAGCASWAPGAPSPRLGCLVLLENVGIPRFERSDEANAYAVPARRYTASRTEVDTSAGVRPLVVRQGAEGGARLSDAGGDAEARL